MHYEALACKTNHSLIHVFIHRRWTPHPVWPPAPQPACVLALAHPTELSTGQIWGPGPGLEACASFRSIGLSDDFKSECNSKLWPLARISWGRKLKPREADRYNYSMCSHSGSPCSLGTQGLPGWTLLGCLCHHCNLGICAAKRPRA